ncbi:hypothetical protein F5Y04DRAFT_279814 [Hypomontagnella monticulosa]|nr:hypothetical protein F5Y04DRAFT_279814 [Hypomontagnella monticulosa]
MKGFKNLLTVGLGFLAVWGSPITPVHDDNRTVGDRLATVLDSRVVPSEVKVAPWAGLGEGTTTEPTFIAELSTVFAGAPSNADVAEYARKGYENMMKQKVQDKDTHLMAALYIPNKKSIYLSSVPAKPAAKLIKDMGATQAPAWWSQVHNRQPSLYLHAEDGAAYLYEASLSKKLAAGDKYPAGSFIAVYGVVNKQAKGPVGLCAGGGDQPLNPPCSTVFTNLGVAF